MTILGNQSQRLSRRWEGQCWTCAGTIWAPRSSWLRATSRCVSVLWFVKSIDCLPQQVKCWDLGSNQAVQIAEHQAPVKACRWVKAPNYSALMTVSWDKTMKFWDTRAPTPMLSIDLPERAYCADVEYPMAVVGTAGRGIVIYQLDGQPREFKKVESPLKYQHRCVSIFKDKKNAPTGFALGSVEGRVAIQYVNAVNPKDNFTFKCHRSTGAVNGFQVMIHFWPSFLLTRPFSIRISLP